MRKKVVVLSLTKNEIVVNFKKKKFLKAPSFAYYVSCGILVLLLSVTLSNTSLSSQMTYVYSPVNSLYSDNSNAIFTSGNFIAKLDFSLPILGAGVENNGDSIEFTIGKSIMIMSIEGGVVSDCGSTLNGVKFIKIKHNESVTSVIENVDIIGISKFDVIKKGQDIATGKVGEKVILKIYENDILVKNLEVKQSKISWQN